MIALSSCSVVIIFLVILPGPHETYVRSAKDSLVFVTWWVGLGILSSVGFGTGLHTFVLYLGPHIAQVTLAATECNTVDLLVEADGSFACPPGDFSSLPPVRLSDIGCKVAWECFLWGAGTAIGELPPYFVARAARLSGDRIAELESLDESVEKGNDCGPWFDRGKLLVYRSLQHFGFWGIMFFASVPNPLFDLAGITCGHFLIPFWKFFGATLIGKAVIKMSLQSTFVITAFSKKHLVAILDGLKYLVPFIADSLSTWLKAQTEKLHVQLGGGVVPEKKKNIIAELWELVVLAMVVFFLISIVNSAVQHYLVIQDEADVQRLIKRREADAEANTTVVTSDDGRRFTSANTHHDHE